MATDLTVANTILEQLGGARFLTMTGARSMVGGADVLSFRLPAGLAKGGINAVRITLTPMDDYTVEALKVRAMAVVTVAACEGVYADALQSAFTAMTGLDTHL